MVLAVCGVHMCNGACCVCGVHMCILSNVYTYICAVGNNEVTMCVCTVHHVCVCAYVHVCVCMVTFCVLTLCCLCVCVCVYTHLLYSLVSTLLFN